MMPTSLRIVAALLFMGCVAGSTLASEDVHWQFDTGG